MQNKNQNKTPFLNDLASVNVDVVIRAVDEIRNSGSLVYIPYLFELLSTTDVIEIRTKVLELLIDVKDMQVVEMYINALKNNNYKNVRKEITQICWSASLNMSAYADLFTQMALNEDYETTIEVLSVFEENKDNFSNEQKNKIVSDLKSGLSAVYAEKKALVVEIIKMIQE